MSNVVLLAEVRERRQQLQERQLYSASPFMSPVPQLIELLEPILEAVREDPLSAAEHELDNLRDYQDLLRLARQEIDQLEDMASFLEGICSENRSK